MPINNQPTNWKVTEDRFVAYIDIMGFKDRVMRSSHEDIYTMMKAIDRAIKINKSINFTSNKKSLIKVTTYSDSIMLYSKDDSSDSFYSLVSTVAGLVYDLFVEGIPHKGAIAYGKMTLDTRNSIFFGQPLIDAYLLQEELHFYGVMIHGSVEEKLMDTINNYPFILSYDCPLKNGKSKHFTVYPMFANPKNADEEGYKGYYDKIIKSFDKMRFKTSGHLRRYIDNTSIYFQSI